GAICPLALIDKIAVTIALSQLRVAFRGCRERSGICQKHREDDRRRSNTDPQIHSSLPTERANARIFAIRSGRPEALHLAGRAIPERRLASFATGIPRVDLISGHRS